MNYATGLYSHLLGSNMNRWYGYLVVFCSLFFTTGGAADPNKNEAEIYLLTVGIGDSMDARFGHTILQVVEPHQPVWDYNWGVFSFSEPNFGLRFFLGQLKYWVERAPGGWTVERYREEKRSVVRERLELTSKQKSALLTRIATNMEGENPYFFYHFYKKNCSTLPRDHLDAVLGGAIDRRYGAEEGTTRYRDYVRKYLNHPFGSEFFLELVMNSENDHRLTLWEEMFLPAKLRQYLMDMPALDDAGNPIPGLSLLTDTKTLVMEPEYPLVYRDLYPWVGGFILLVWMSLLLHLRAGKRYPRGVGVFLCLWGLISGGLGTVMLVSWIFSGHSILWHNANLWVCWPVDIVFFYAGVRWMRGKQDSLPWDRFFSRFCFLHGGALLGAGLLWSLGGIQQDISKILFYLGLPLVGLWVTLGWLSDIQRRTSLNHREK